jgi:hypothetical protein
MLCLLRWRSWDLMPAEADAGGNLGDPVGAAQS